MDGANALSHLTIYCLKLDKIMENRKILSSFFELKEAKFRFTKYAPAYSLSY